MAEITFEQFKTEVLDNIKEYLSEEYRDYDMKLQTVQKSGEAYEALLITPKDKQKGATVTPALNLNRAYSIYTKGKPLTEVIADLAEIRMTAKYPQARFRKEDLTTYSKVKDMIVPRLIRKAGNSEYLADKPHTDVADLTLTYAVRIEGEDDFADAVITDKLLQVYGITAEELHNVAMENLAAGEPLFTSLEQTLLRINKSLDIEKINVNDYVAQLFILSNKHTTLGAVEAINPAIMDRLYNKLGKLYIIPSSVHEVIITPQDQIEDVGELRKIVCNVNATDVKPTDVLSDNVYEYDIDKKTIKVVA